MRFFKFNTIMVVSMICLCTTLTQRLFSQSINKQWKQELAQVLDEYKNCNDASCLEALGKSVDVVYNVKDFFSSERSQYLGVQEISKKLDEGKNWKLVGPAYKQEILEQGQEMANLGKPVLAVYKNKEGQVLHMAVVIPGELVYSASWAMKVPGVASFFAHQPEKSFIDHGLSYAFTKSMLLNLHLYARN